ncbi:helix-turn-helix domain-containing protein [Protaetiibacter intestinalis]|uniref:GAF domain-containing protein n=1 Tax=Protaetiibacter intestinalis TaxID=2419774 RepID=A0A387BH70_9MICO|nr:helix-turn-helix domain-containing protein [Protaetiibacter intestinalis]AYF97870.1 GAF domain-containing protein [Protaetiibacter intestinalis]
MTDDALAAALAENGRLRRRAAELEALFSTARELVRLRDVDEVLSRLVERAHALMGTDVTYLSEAQGADGELRVRYTAGTVTPEFRRLRVPAGVGLASLVVRTREPVRVPRYEAMSEAPHDAHIDAVVRAEGLVSFLGVPLAVGDEVLGALFACNRSPHEFAPEQVLLLSAFADHAAAVLHSARLLAAASAATIRAEEAYRELERHLSASALAVVAERRAGWLLDAIDGRAPADADDGVAAPAGFTGCAVLAVAARGLVDAVRVVERAVGDAGFVAAWNGRIAIAWTAPEVVAETERVRRIAADALRDPGLTAVALRRELARAGLREGLERAVRDLELLPALGVTGATVSSDAFAPYQVLAPADPAALDGFIAELLGPVLAWDERRGARLVDTLGAYFDAGESRGATAATLRIHPNTVQQRLDRIQALLDGALADPERRFRVQAAVRLELLRRAVRAAASG